MAHVVLKQIGINMKKVFSKLNSYLFKSLGYAITKIDNPLRAEFFYSWLKNLNIPCNVIYDIGANDGSYSMNIQKIFPTSNFFLFEANDEHDKALRNTGFNYFIALLYSKNTQVPFYKLNKTGDSIFKENYNGSYDVIDSTLMSTITLDSLIKNKNLPYPDMVKIHTQGSELEILQVGTTILHNASVVILELPILNYNSNSPKISEILEFMSDNNFVPVKLVESHRIANCLIQIDIAFMPLKIVSQTFGDKKRDFL